MQTKKTIASLVLLATSGLSSNVFATTYDIDTPVDEALFVSFELPPIGTFSDTYNFTIDAPGTLAASVTNHSLQSGATSVLNIMGLTMSIFDEANSLLASVSSGFSLYGPVLAGDYHALVTGEAVGIEGGAYMLSIFASAIPDLGGGNPTPVPVPAALWLLGSGLLGLMGISRQKV